MPIGGVHTMEKSKRTDYYREQKRRKRAENKKRELGEAVANGRTKAEQYFVEGHMLKRQHYTDVAVLSADRFGGD